MFRDLLVREFSPYGRLRASQLDQLEEHYGLLRTWNQKLNLTRIQSVEDAVRLHYCESLFLARELPAGSLRIADIGSGGGFPGIPIAVFRPECMVTLIESHQRKGVFLREASRRLVNVTVVASRAESAPDGFDWAVSRGVSPARVILAKPARNLALLAAAGISAAAGPGCSVQKLPWGERRVIVFQAEQA